MMALDCTAHHSACKRRLNVDNEQNYMKSGNRFKQMTVSKSSAYQNNVSVFGVALGFPLRNESYRQRQREGLATENAMRSKANFY